MPLFVRSFDFERAGDAPTRALLQDRPSTHIPPSRLKNDQAEPPRGQSAGADESELVLGLRARDEAAVTSFLDRYRALFQHCIAQFENNAASREDLFQDLVWHAIERLDVQTFDPDKGSFGTWLYRVAWCRCVDLKRQQNARRRVKMKQPETELPDEPDPHPGPREAVGDLEIGELVRSAMAELEPEERALLEYRHVDEATLNEVSAQLGITLEQTKYRLKRAEAALRKALLARIPRVEAVE